MHPRELKISDYTYNLPADRIASHPLEQRGNSKLLVYRNGNISVDIYKNVAEHLPKNSLVIFNDTKVIPARVLFQKATGAVIEIFCLEPYGKIKDYNSVMSHTASSEWKVMIGGAAKWKSGNLEKSIDYNNEKIVLRVTLIDKTPEAYVARFSWTPASYTFAEVIQPAGAVPLPPYIKRQANEEDKSRYQTIFATHDGSVAAPTAALHFTNEILISLEDKNIEKAFVTLHVGAGTFKPVKSATMEDHVMHSEWMDVSLKTLKILASHKNEITSVGTTATRTLESLYWMGIKAMDDTNISVEELSIKQWEVYEFESDVMKQQALLSLIEWMQKRSVTNLFCATELMIAPGYKFRMIDALITNFHQPASTLLLLVAAAIGDDWRSVYDFALQNEFRFLSYGDGSVLYINTDNKV